MRHGHTASQNDGHATAISLSFYAKTTKFVLYQTAEQNTGRSATGFAYTGLTFLTTVVYESGSLQQVHAPRRNAAHAADCGELSVFVA